MRRNRILSAEPGVYLFRAPTNVTIEINDQVVVTFLSSYHRAAGIVLAPTHVKRKDLEALLETLLRKMTKEMNPPATDLEVKIFGGREPNTPLLDAADTWVRAQALKLAARDVGRAVSRTLTIECATGKVGVQYAESAVQAGFLVGGSARQRLRPDGAPSEILVLAENRARQTLARQAIEEHRNCVASVPADPNPTLKKPKFKTAEFNAVLVSEDISARDKAKSFLTELEKQKPLVRKMWSGDTLPSFAGNKCRLRLLPPIDAESIDVFKQELASALSEQLIDPANSANVVPFRVKRRKR
jgi:hypothetical protein